MALSTERVQLEAALLALLAGMDTGAGGGTISPSRLSIINYVKAKLDELVPQGEGVTFNLSSEPNISNPWDLLIDAHLDECTKDVQLSAPMSVLTPVVSDPITGTPYTRDPQTGYFVLPDNFLRLSHFKMADWWRILEEKETITPAQVGKYKKQFNKWLKGTPSKPVGSIDWKNIAGSSPAETPGEIVLAFNYGSLYNWYVVDDPRGICPEGWHVPTKEEWITLMNLLGTYNNEISSPPEFAQWDGAQVKLQEIGLDHWNDVNSDGLGDGTNETGFTAVGSGIRTLTGLGTELEEIVYSDIKDVCRFLSTTLESGLSTDDMPIHLMLYGWGAVYKFMGCSIRLIKDDSAWTSGDTVTDHDGNVYPTVKIGDQVWMASNLILEHFNNGDAISIIEDPTLWRNSVLPAMCYYENLKSNSYTKTITPATGGMKRIIEYFSVDQSHAVEELLYIPERKAEDLIAVNPNLIDSLAWQCAGKIMQIIGQMEPAKLAQERVTQSYNFKP